MKKQDITYQDKLNELRLDLSHPNSKGHTFILVEGQSDIKIFRKLFNLQKCKVENVPGGKSKLEECVTDLVKKYALIIGIRDADFLHLTNNGYNVRNVFLTDYHDLEMSLISEDQTFSAILFEYTTVEESSHCNVRTTILKTIEDISYLKWLNDIESLQLKFEVGFQDLLSFDTVRINFDDYFKRVLSKSPDAKITDIKIVSAKIEELKTTNPHPLQLCNGHDFMKALSQYIKINDGPKAMNDEIVCSAFRINYRTELLSNTQLYFKTNQWCQDNNCSIY